MSTATRNRPRAPRTSIATPKQLGLISDLLNRKAVAPDTAQGIAFLVSVAERAREGKVKSDDPQPMTVAQGSEWITTLLDMDPRPNPAAPSKGAKIESPGVFEFDGAVYAVVRAKAGHLYAKVYSDPNGETVVANWHEPESVRQTFAPGMMGKLREHHRASDERVRELGTLTHRCIDCGAELSLPESIARGKGPVCASKR